MDDYQIASIKAFWHGPGEDVLVVIDSPATEVAFVMSPEQRNAFVYNLMNPIRRGHTPGHSGDGSPAGDKP